MLLTRFRCDQPLSDFLCCGFVHGPKPGRFMDRFGIGELFREHFKTAIQ
jgi:hypothetical protein